MSVFRVPFPAAAALLGLVLVSCGETRENVHSEIGQVGSRVEAGLIRFNQREGMRAGGTQISDGIFMAAQPQRASQAGQLPAEVQGASSISLVSREPMSLTQIADRLSEIAGIAHVTVLGPTGVAQTQGEPDDDEDAEDSDGGTAAAAARPGSSAGRISIRPRLRGPLSEVLNELATAFDVEWSYEDGRVVFRDFVTRQYQLATLASSMSGSTSVGSVSSAVALDVWGEIEAAIEGLAGEESSINVGATTGLVTVTARLGDHERIRDYVARMNKVLGQQIAFDVNVLTISLEDAQGVGIDLTAALAGNGGDSIDWSGGQRLGNAIGAVNVGLVQGDFSLDMVIDALARHGQVAVETRTGGTTTNNRLVPVQVVEETAYVRSTEAVLNDAGQVVGTAVTPATITTGFTMSLLPRILNTREIMMEYSITLSDLNQISDFGSIQLPETSNTSFQQQVILRNGQTLVLAGFERRRLSMDQQGVGTPGFILLGGQDTAEAERVAQVITITPRILARRSPTR